MNEESVGFTTSAGQTFVPGVQGFSSGANFPNADPDAVSPSAIRWLFNPFAYISVTERPVSGHSYLTPGAFIPIKNQVQRKSTSGISSSPGRSYYWQPDDKPQEVGTAVNPVQPGQYRNETRTAYAIATEMEQAYSDKGVRILPSLTKFEDPDAAASLHKLLIADGLEFTTDPYQPDQPVPNLVKFEKYLVSTGHQKAVKIAGAGDSKLAVDPVALVQDVLVGVRTALGLCRNVTREAKRVVANRTIGHVHAFDAWHTRCFLALGETVPSDLPFVSDSGHMSAPGMTSPDTAELARLRAENEELRTEKMRGEMEALRAENERLLAIANPTTEEPEPVTDAGKRAKCAFIREGGSQCKRNATTDDGYCAEHQLKEADGKETELVEGVNLKQ